MATDSGPVETSPLVSLNTFKITIWMLCAFTAVLWASRFAVRISLQGRLMFNDYFLVAALPMLLAASGLLQTILGTLYLDKSVAFYVDQHNYVQPSSATSRLTAAFELSWIAIYCVKFCFLTQFKFHKPPYAYVSAHLTRYYWASIAICGVAFLATIVHVITLCPNPEKCYYRSQSGAVAREMSVTVLDIVTDLLVISIPTLLIHMAKFSPFYTIVNWTFKSLSLFAIVVSVTRMVLQYDAEAHRIRYLASSFLLIIEAAVGISMASISSYRVVVLDHLAKICPRENSIPLQPGSHHTGRQVTCSRESEGTSAQRHDSNANLVTGPA